MTATRLTKRTPSLLLAFAASFCAMPSPRVAAAQAPARLAAKWERYAFPGDEFSVELPAAPFLLRTYRQVGADEAAPMRVYGLYADDVVYLTVAFDSPRPGESFKDLARHVGGNFGLGDPRDLRSGEYQGRELRGALGGYESVTRVFKTRKRAYLVRVIATDASNPSSTRFLDSLALAENPRGLVIGKAAPAGDKGGGEDEPRGTLPADGARAAGSGADAGRVYRPAEVTRKAVIVFKPDPGYTAEARRRNVKGVVRLGVILGADGTARDINVLKALPHGLTERALTAARFMLFFPARKDGRAVPQHVTLEYNFDIY